MPADIKQMWLAGHQRIMTLLENKVTVTFYRRVEAGTSSEYDSFFQESTDPAKGREYDEAGLIVTQSHSKELACIIHTDIYALGAPSQNKYSGYLDSVGKFFPGVYLITVMLRDVLLPGGKTIFHDCEYITLSGHEGRFKVREPEYRGLGAFKVADIFIERVV